MEAINPIVVFAVSEKSEGNAWHSLVESTCTALKSVPQDAVESVFVGWCAANEEEYKKEYDNPVPGKYRSAKSVIRKALRKQVPLMNNGEVVGKSALEALCKDAPLPKDLLDKWETFLRAFDKEGDADMRNEVFASIGDWVKSRS